MDSLLSFRTALCAGHGQGWNSWDHTAQAAGPTPAFSVVLHIPETLRSRLILAMAKTKTILAGTSEITSSNILHFLAFSCDHIQKMVEPVALPRQLELLQPPESNLLHHSQAMAVATVRDSRPWGELSDKTRWRRLDIASAALRESMIPALRGILHATDTAGQPYNTTALLKIVFEHLNRQRSSKTKGEAGQIDVMSVIPDDAALDLQDLGRSTAAQENREEYR